MRNSRTLKRLLLAAIAVVVGLAAPVAASAQGPIWGDVVSGLKIGIALAPDDERSIDVSFHNSGESSVLLNLGVMLDNGRVMEPSALRLAVKQRDGSVHVSRWSRPLHVGGRMDDFIVSLRVGATYTLRLIVTDFRGPSLLEHASRGPVRLSVLFEGRKPQMTTPGLSDLHLMRWWLGQAESGDLELGSR